MHIGDEEIEVHGPGAMLALEPGEEVTLSTDAPARVMLVGGAPLDGPRHIWWNFVSSDKERIERAKRDGEAISPNDPDLNWAISQFKITDDSLHAEPKNETA